METITSPGTVQAPPVMALNKLVRYLNASSLQRKNLIRDQKYPHPEKPHWYHLSKEVIMRFFLEENQEQAFLQDTLKHLAENTPTDEATAHVRQISCEALEHFAGLADRLPLRGFHFALPDLAQTDIVRIGGLEVCCRPDLLFSGRYRGKDVSGAIRFHFGKTQPLSQAENQDVAALLFRCLDASGDFPRLHPAFCLSVDIFTGDISASPRNHTQLWKEATIACEEIAANWMRL